MVVCVRDLLVVFVCWIIAYFSNFLSLQVEGYVYVGCCLHVNMLLCTYMYIIYVFKLIHKNAICTLDYQLHTTLI